MHVLYYHQYFTTRSGSGGTRSYEMAKALIARGHKVTVVCAQSSGSDAGPLKSSGRGYSTGEVDGIKVIQFELGYSNHLSLVQRALVFVKFAWRSTRLALSLDYDLIFATTTPLTIAIPGIVAKAIRRKPFVFEVRDLWPELPKAMGVVRNPLILFGLSALEYTAYKLADACIALAPGIKQGIVRRGIPESRVRVVPNGSDMDLFVAARVARPSGLEQAKCIAVFSGAHGLANGLHRVLDAAAELLKRNRSDIKILFVGDGKVKPSLVTRAQTENLTNCVFWKPIPKHEMPALLASVDVGLMVLDDVPAFYYGTSPNKFFDYIAAGLPVLNNYPGWLAGMIEEQRCGKVVPPRDAQAFAQALIDMADQPDLRKQMGERSKSLAQLQFDRGKLASAFCEVIETTYPGVGRSKP